MEDITDNEEYTHFIQFFFRKIQTYKNKYNISLLINHLEKLIEKTNRDHIKLRAKNFQKYLFKIINIYYNQNH